MELADQIRAKGVDTIACMAVNDVFVMNAWGKSSSVGDKIVMLADGNGEYAKALGLELDAKGYGMGMRGQRFAIVVKDGVATQRRRRGARTVQGVRGRVRARAALAASAALDLGDDLEQVAHQADVGHLEDRRLAILVDGDDGARVLDARQVLDGTGDADRHVQLRRDDLAGLPDLHLVGRVAGVHRGA